MMPNKTSLTHCGLPGWRWFKTTLRLAQITVVALIATAATGSAQTVGKKPNILIIWGDDIGYWNISAYNQGMMGYKTPNIDRVAKASFPSSCSA
jgi:hypothetical protein